MSNLDKILMDIERAGRRVKQRNAKFKKTLAEKRPPSIEYVKFCNEMGSTFKDPPARLTLNVGTVLYASNWTILGQSLQATGLGMELLTLNKIEGC